MATEPSCVILSGAKNLALRARTYAEAEILRLRAQNDTNFLSGGAA